MKSKKEIQVEVMQILGRIIEDENRLPRGINDNFGENIDSLEFVMMFVELEETYGIQINDEDFEIENASTINKVSELILKYILDNKTAENDEV